jgi:uncharacterized protein YoxC
MNSNKADEDELLYKTIDSLEKRAKKSFVQNVLIVSVIILALALIAVFVLLLSAKKDLKEKELLEEQDKLVQQKVQLQADKAETEDLLVKTSDVLSSIDTNLISEEVTSEVKAELLQNVAAIKRKVDTITSSRHLSYTDIIFVWSNSGLNVRDGPILEDGKVLWGFPMGTNLTKLPQEVTHESSLRIMEGKITLSGFMQHIKRDSIKGYVFTGLTSPLPVFRSAENLTQYWSLLESNTVFVERYALEIEKFENENRISISGKNLSINDLFLLIRNVYKLDKYLEKGLEFSAKQTDTSWKIRAGNLLIDINKEGSRVKALVRPKPADQPGK